MQIRTRLTLQYLLIGGIIMLVASMAIYLSSAGFRRDDFYERLENKAVNTARLLIEVDEIDVDLLKKIEADNPVSLPGEKIIILNYTDEILYSSDEAAVINITRHMANQVRLSEKMRFRQDQYEVLGLLYTERYDRFVVFAAATDTDGFTKLRNLRIILLFVCLISFVIFAVAGWLFAGKALKPISGVVSQVEEITFASLNLRVDEGNGTDEIARLARTFNNMLERLEIAFRTQKDFISNASHELRTPLTSIHGQMEVLLMKERTGEEYKKAVSSVLDDIRNLIDLSNRLLLLAQTSAGKQNSGHRPVRIDEVLWQVKEEFNKLRKEFQINISLGKGLIDSDLLVVSGDDFLLKTAFSNIIENAYKYSGDNSMDIDIEYAGGHLSMVFADRGIGIPQDDLTHISEPFHRGSNVKAPGHGIGLSLVFQIIRNHNGSVSIESSAGKGTRVILGFPQITV
ncbi:MAG: ATP-binding protein [Bacteroidales bacterium]|jgi:signal transduction histidine kinase|nr:ATP-binding protein [Bacteroidales bacterium]